MLLTDKGPDVQLISWDLENFTKKGDNFVSNVIALNVKYLEKNEELDKSYVAKFSPTIGSETTKHCIRIMSVNESHFYTKFLPEANEILKSCGQEPLHYPQCFHSTLIQDKERIFFEDLRPRHFKMIDKVKGMDVAHANLTLEEMARLHASSLLLQKKYSEPLEVRYDQVSTNLYELAFDVVDSVYGNAVKSAIKMLKSHGGYGNAITWLETVNSQMKDILTTKSLTNRYDVIIHGDCWSNNTLFRYDSENLPTEVMLLDLQWDRKASPACDLTYFMYSSLTSEVRKSNCNLFLSHYYNSFKEVLKAGDMAMPFSEEELIEDFKNQRPFATLIAMFFFTMICTPADAQDDQDIRGDFDALAGLDKKAVDLFTSNKMFRESLLSIVDELMEDH